MDWDKKRDELAEDMNPCTVWKKGTDSQQEFADQLVDEFCKRFAKYLCWAIRDNILKEDDVFDIKIEIFSSINRMEDASWWCDRKDADDFDIALKLLKDFDVYVENIKKIKKEYNR